MAIPNWKQRREVIWCRDRQKLIGEKLIAIKCNQLTDFRLWAITINWLLDAINCIAFDLLVIMSFIMSKAEHDNGYIETRFL